MTTKKFLVEFEFDERTRWRVSDKDLAERLQLVCEIPARMDTDGPVPRVTVTPGPPCVA